MRFRAPATSANIGAGFDTAAVAFDLWNELEVTEGEGVVVEGEGAAELAADGTNLAVRAYALLADPAGKRFSFVNRIPLERGLGSSAAAIALGLVAAAPDAGAEELLAAGLTLEPHADNLAAAQAPQPPVRRLLASQCPAPVTMVRSGWVRAMLKESLRRIARFSGALSLRLRLASSSKVTSSTQCSPFSTPQ